MSSAISISDYSAAWPGMFARERTLFLSACVDLSVVVEHIGSTAVPGLAAKPIIDILVGLRSLAEIETRVEQLAKVGFVYVPEHESAMPERRFFRRSTHGQRISHVHAVVQGTQFWLEHLAFRDALCKSEALVAQYAELKRRLAPEFAHDREAYTDAKAPFIRSVLAAATASRPGV